MTVDFDKWFAEQGRRVASNSPTMEGPTIDDNLPEGVWDRDGRYVCECCVCGRICELPVDVSEIGQEGCEHYCGSSPQCCP
jgi:hypothetical protein